MRLLATLGLAEAPCVAAGYAAVHYRALGASEGVIWCLLLIGLLLAAGVVAADAERRLG